MASGDLYTVICEHLSDEIWVTDGNGKTLYVNQRCEDFYGVKPEVLLGRNVQDLEEEGYFSPAVTPLVIEKRRQVALPQRTRCGKTLLITATPVFDEEGGIRYVVASSKDLTVWDNAAKSERRRSKPSSTETGASSDAASLDGFLIPVSRESATSCAIDLVECAASSDVNVLITGETGTGKTMLAQYIHNKSRRSGGPFLKLSCPTVPEGLLESELFGYRAGAFTGASRSGKPGLLQMADGGSVFLDEIGDLPMSIQPKLLQAVEEHRFIPVGGTASTHSDMRIISATNQDLSSLVRAGRFRSDLLYRLSVLNITIPPLRQRKKEIPEYAEHFMNRLHQKYGVKKRLNPGAMGTLLEYDWPGNLRELQHVLEYLVLTSPKPVIDEENLPEHLRRKRSCAAPAPDKGEKYSRQSLIDLYDKTHSTYRVAKAVGLSQSTVYRLIGDYVKRSRDRA